MSTYMLSLKYFFLIPKVKKRKNNVNMYKYYECGRNILVEWEKYQ